MSFSSTFSAADPLGESGAMPGAQGPGTEGGGRRLLGLVQRMIQTGMAMARGVNLIARQRLAGQDLSLLGPAGFNPTLASALVVQAVAWTAALRERLMVMAVRPPFTRGLPRPDRAPQGRSAPFCPPENLAEPTAQDWHNWQELARPWRMGPGGVAVATRAIAGMPDREVVAQICGKLSQAAAELGAEADVARIAALEAAARALCPDVDAAPDATEDGPVDSGGAEGGPDVWDVGSPPDGSAAGVGRDRPPPAPD
jgi:hypothetical protein